MIESTSLKGITMTKIEEVQNRHIPSKRAKKNEEGVLEQNDRIWLPKQVEELEWKIMIRALCGNSCHRGHETTKNAIASEFCWKDMSEDVKDFVFGCIHCIITKAGERVPRPLPTALHGERPNKVVHLGFTYMGEAKDVYTKYVLVTKDNLTACSWLIPCSSPDGEAALNALSRWIAFFGSMDWIVSDGGPHFKNTLIPQIYGEMRIRHHFTTACFPWADGTIGQICKETLRAERTVLSEWRLSSKEWLSIILCVPQIINQSPLRRLRRDYKGEWKCPLEVFIGRKPSGLIFKHPVIKYRTSVDSISQGRMCEIIRINTLHRTLDEMHKSVSDNHKKNESKAQRFHNSGSNLLPYNFHVGDHVMVRLANAWRIKLSTGWTGPKRMLEANYDLVIEVENWCRSEKKEVQTQRLMPFSNSQSNSDMTREMRELAE